MRLKYKKDPDKVMESNTGNFDINNPYKYSYINKKEHWYENS